MNLYFRLIFLLFGLIGPARKGLLDESRIAFRVLPTDCDINLHMNNGRYLSLMDLGRVHLLKQIGLLGVVLKRKWKPVLAAADIHFIRQLSPFRRFELVTRIVTWDDKYAYMEQRFESGGVLCAHAYVKGLFLDGRGRVPNESVVAETGYRDAPPPCPEELRLWIEFGSVKKQNA